MIFFSSHCSYADVALRTFPLPFPAVMGVCESGMPLCQCGPICMSICVCVHGMCMNVWVSSLFLAMLSTWATGLGRGELVFHTCWCWAHREAGGREGTETAQLVQLSELPLPAGIPPHAWVPRLSSSLYVLQRENWLPWDPLDPE